MFNELYLASSSPRRQALLRQIDIEPYLLRIQVDETANTDEDPAALVKRLALSKARAGWSAPLRTLNLPVLGADTLVLIRGQTLTKPTDKSHAVAMLEKLSGTTHEVITAVAIIRAKQVECATSVTRVTLVRLSTDDIEHYVAREEPFDKAGGYGIQGLAARFVSRIEGSYSGIVGLPLHTTWSLLRRF